MKKPWEYMSDRRFLAYSKKVDRRLVKKKNKYAVPRVARHAGREMIAFHNAVIMELGSIGFT